MANTWPQRAGPGPLWPCGGHVRTYFLVFAHFQTIFVHVHVQVDDVHVQVQVDDVHVQVQVGR